MRFVRAGVRFDGDLQIVTFFGADGQSVEVEGPSPDWYLVAAGRDVGLVRTEGRARERFLSGVTDVEQFEAELAVEVA